MRASRRHHQDHAAQGCDADHDQRRVGQLAQAVCGSGCLSRIHRVARLIVPDGPAAKSGLQKDDVIVAMNGKEVDGRSLRNAVGSMAPGTSINLKVLRNGAERALTVTLDRMPEETRRASR